MRRERHEYLKNPVITDAISSFQDVVNLETSLRRRGAGEYTDDGLARIKKLLTAARDMEAVWMLLQDMVEMEDLTSEGIRSGAPTAGEWERAFDAAREIFSQYQATTPAMAPNN